MSTAPIISIVTDANIVKPASPLSLIDCRIIRNAPISVACARAFNAADEVELDPREHRAQPKATNLSSESSHAFERSVFSFGGLSGRFGGRGNREIASFKDRCICS